MNIGLALDKKNGVESKVVGKGKSGSADTHTRCMNSITQKGSEVFGGEYEIKEANNQNDYLKLIEEELKKQGVENIEWK